MDDTAHIRTTARSTGKPLPVSFVAVSLWIQLIDGAVIVLSGVIPFYVYNVIGVPLDLPFFLAAILLALLIAQNVFRALGLYSPDTLRGHDRVYQKILLGWAVVLLAVVAVAFLSKTSTSFSRVVFLAWFVVGTAGLFAVRYGLRRHVVRWRQEGRLQQRIAIVGAGDNTPAIIDYFLADPRNQYDLVGIFDDRGQRVPDSIRDIPKLGTVEDLVSFAQENHVDLVLIVLPWSAEERIFSIVRKLAPLPVDLRLCPELPARNLYLKGYTEVSGLPVLRVLDRPLDDKQLILKNVSDKVFASLMLLCLSPLLLIVAVMLKIDSRGPVFFRQKRFGFNNQLIEVFKFRTMYQEDADANAKRLTERNDPRVTRLGRILRKTSIDELPQLFNVLIGDMSLVGPRPHPIEAKAANKLYFDIMDEYATRHRIKPGITGWAQVNGWRGNTDTEEKLRKRVEHDLYYIDNWSLWFDLKILLRTVVEVFRQRNAF